MGTPHEFKARPQSITNLEDLYTPQELDLPDPTTGKKVQTVQQTSVKKQEYNMQESMSSSQINGSHIEESSKQQLMLERTIGDGAITLGQVMTPVQEPDSNSLKRRNP